MFYFTEAREIRDCVTQLELLDPELLPAARACAGRQRIYELYSRTFLFFKGHVRDNFW